MFTHSNDDTTNYPRKIAYCARQSAQAADRAFRLMATYANDDYLLTSIKIEIVSEQYEAAAWSEIALSYRLGLLNGEGA